VLKKETLKMNTTNETTKHGVISLYACGGAGLNIASHIAEQNKDYEPNGFAHVQTTFIDTSRSNLNAVHSPEQTYLITGLDGSGKRRAENHKRIAEEVIPILNNFRPGDISILLSSASGGSGSVIAPTIAKELLEREEQVIAVAVLSSASRVEIQNSINTLKSYENIARIAQKPIPIILHENVPTEKRQRIDSQIRQDLVQLAALFSRQNGELDSADLRHFIDYTKVINHPPHLVSLLIHSKTLQVEKTAQVLTVATLATLDTGNDVGQPLEYHATGILNTANTELKLTEPLHFYLVDGLIPDVIKRYEGMLSDLDAKRRVVVNKSISVDGGDESEAGLIL
jgi:hypothetical protein